MITSLQKRKENGLLRELMLPLDADFVSNDYLGLARSTALFDSIEREYSRYKQIGSTGSRLLSGNSQESIELESFLSDYHQSESCLLVNSGFDANMGLFSCIGGPDDHILLDELVHASVHVGCRLSKAPHSFFKHNDVQDFCRKVHELKNKTIYVGVESVYSMDGDLCPIKELLDAAPHVKLIVDEAHATGFYGPGLVSHLSLESRVFARIVTFGKGLGVHGACILGSDLLKQYLINYCKPVVFSTFLPRHALVSISCAYKHMIAHPELAVELRKRIDYFRERMKSFGDRLLPSVTPIQGLIVPGNHQVVKASKILQSKGLDVRPIRSPTVPKGRERLRICLHANNTYEQLDLLCMSLNEARL